MLKKQSDQMFHTIAFLEASVKRIEAENILWGEQAVPKQSENVHMVEEIRRTCSALVETKKNESAKRDERESILLDHTFSVMHISSIPAARTRNSRSHYLMKFWNCAEILRLAKVSKYPR